MNNNFYYACQHKANGKYYATVLTVHGSTNLCNLIDNYKQNGIITMNACKTLKSARDCVEKWNNDFKKNNIYLY